MAINNGQNVQQAYVIPGTDIRKGQTPVQLELFDPEGNPWAPEGGSDGMTEAQVNAAITAAVEPLEQRIEALENAGE